MTQDSTVHGNSKLQDKCNPIEISSLFSITQKWARNKFTSRRFIWLWNADTWFEKNEYEMIYVKGPRGRILTSKQEMNK
jgi:hypothetical protein